MPDWTVALLVGAAMVLVNIVVGLRNGGRVEGILTTKVEELGRRMDHSDEHNRDEHSKLHARITRERDDREAALQNYITRRECEVIYRTRVAGAGGD